MKHCTWVLGALLAAAPLPAGGEHERGLRAMEEGRYDDAVAAFRKALEDAPEDAELHYNLALALWRSGAVDEAEVAAEKAAALSGGRLEPLRDGILGNLRMAQAQARLAGEQPDLQAARERAVRARDAFLAGTAHPGAPATLARNLQRALELIADIDRRIEQQEKQDEQQKQDQQQQENDEQKEQQPEEGEPQQQDQHKQQDQRGDDKKQDEQQQQQQQPPPESNEEQPQQEPQQPGEQEPQQPGEQEPQPQQGEEQQPAQAQAGEERELSPEERKRLLEALQQILEQHAQLQQMQKARRPRVEKDW